MIQSTDLQLRQPTPAVVHPPAAASLEHMSGRERGRVSWLTATTEQVDVHGGVSVRLTAPNGSADSQPYLRLHRAGDTYELEVMEGRRVWVNGERADSRTLHSGDLIELGEGGPLLRFRTYPDGTRLHKSMTEILSDCVDSARVRRRGPLAMAVTFFAHLLRDLATRTTVLFRTTVIIVLIALSASTLMLGRSNVELRQRLIEEASRLESFAESLVTAQSEALRSGDLARLREEIGSSLVETGERVSALEERTTAGARVIATASQSVVFLQGAYGFWNPDSGQVLRHLVDDLGNRLAAPGGQPLLTLEGDGPPAERQFTGTAFVVTSEGVLLTNRHLARPWQDDPSTAVLARQQLVPRMTRFLGFLPGVEEPFEVSLLAVSDEADLAILGCTEVTVALPHLELAAQPPRPGDEVLVLGFPTGLRSMLAQTGEQFVDRLREENETDFWRVAQRLAAEHYIRPLASRGIVGQVSEAAVVYDAETTHGGSGGPVLDLDGRVVAVNTAILPEYGGSNIGIPAGFVRRLLQQAGVAIP